MKISRTVLFVAGLLIQVMLSGCASDGRSSVGGSVYYGYGYDRYYGRDYYYGGDIIVRPPPSSRPPRPVHPIERPPTRPQPRPLPARPMPVQRPSRR